jgi:hypothetical protein
VEGATQAEPHGPQGGVGDPSNHTQEDDAHLNDDFDQHDNDFGHGDGTDNALNQNEHRSNLDNRPAQHGGNPVADFDLDKMAHIATLLKHVRDLSFIRTLRNATLDDGIGLTGDALHCLCNPPREALQPDLNTKLVLSIFLRSNTLQNRRTRQSAKAFIIAIQIPRFQISTMPSSYLSISVG